MMDEFGQKSRAEGNEINNSVGSLKNSWQIWAKQHADYQKQNPFSNVIQPGTADLDTKDPEYGKPKAGTLTEKRGKDAHRHLGKEVEELCRVIRNIGVTAEDGPTRVTFGKLFDTYVTISNKLVGVLLRARKHGLLHFEGEMLWQGRDDHVVITLLE
ncbi:actin-binding Rho-activating protein-like [Bufo gargarizans]|uniref:actin-binding Rho-activating protein-like n=1 Tax=Bufo gargarizans TaxID=30331 RepID=UPI001CF523E8|nr:actin-binding Rho-activating protein-like [Bufo gargarizans]XP_044146788.1 actin-binding Rho-activating protein-like [Bufo gargarizans]